MWVSTGKQCGFSSTETNKKHTRGFLQTEPVIRQ